MELLSGRRAVDKSKVGVEQNLVDWARPYLGDRRKLFRIMDINLQGQYPQKSAYMMAILALQCISEAKIRPPMAEVLRALEQVSSPRGVSSPSHSELHNIPSPRIKSPLKNNYSSSPVGMSPRGSQLSPHSRSPHLKSPRGR